jgi:putative methionine-R-sulfoxide reductase with GAF domain
MVIAKFLGPFQGRSLPLTMIKFADTIATVATTELVTLADASKINLHHMPFATDIAIATPANIATTADAEF